MVLTGGTHRLQIPTKGATLAFTEQNKRRLHARLCEVIGTEEADILMEQLPPFTWTDFVTKQNLDELRNSLKRDLEEQSVGLKHDIEFSAIATRTELEQMITKSRNDLEQAFTQTRTDLGNVITKTQTDLENVITKTRTDLEKSIMEVKHSVETTKLELTGSILELTATMERGFRNQSWKMFTAIMSSQLVTVGLLGLMINSLR
jgi:exonuclease VII large subunit